MNVQKVFPHYRRNYSVFLGEATLFGVGLVFASTTTVLPDFVSRLTGSAVFVGLIVSLSEGAAIAAVGLRKPLDEQTSERTLADQGWHGGSSNVSTVRHCVGVGP